MRERDRVELQRFKEQQAAEEQRQREEAERPVREAEARLTETIRQLCSAEKNIVLSGQPDPGFVLPPSVAGRQMRFADAQRFNAEEARKFREATPEYYPSKKNFETIRDYLAAQKVAIVDAATWKAAFERLRALGLLEERPEPEQSQQEPERLPEREPEQSAQQSRNDYYSKVVATDPRTGEGLTEYQLDQLPSAEYARIMRVPRFDGFLAPSRSV